PRLFNSHSQPKAQSGIHRCLNARLSHPGKRVSASIEPSVSQRFTAQPAPSSVPSPRRDPRPDKRPEAPCACALARPPLALGRAECRSPRPPEPSSAASAAPPPRSPAGARPTGRGESNAANVESTSLGALHDLESTRERPQLPDDNGHDFDDHERRHPNTLMSTQPTASTAA